MRIFRSYFYWVNLNFVVNFVNYFFTNRFLVSLVIFIPPFSNGTSPIYTFKFSYYSWLIIFAFFLLNINKISSKPFRIGKYSVLISLFALSFFLSFIFGFNYTNLTTFGLSFDFTYSHVVLWTINLVLIQIFLLFFVSLSINSLEDIKFFIKIFILSGFVVNLFNIFLMLKGFSTQNSRMTGTFEDPNYFARFEVFIISILFIYIFFKKIKFSNQILASVLLITCLIFQFFSYSRGSYFSLAISLCFIILFLNKSSMTKYVLILFSLVVLGIIMSFLLAKRLPTTSGTFSSLLDYSNIFRIITNYYGLEAFIDKPIFGIGFRNFYNYYINISHTSISTSGAFIVEYIHNYYISILGEQGLFGFVPFSLIIYFIFKDLTRKIKKSVIMENKIVGVMIFSLLIIYFFNGLFYPFLVPDLELPFFGGLFCGYIKINDY